VIVSLAEMKVGEIGMIIDMDTGHGFASRIQNMGIRRGSGIKKISGHMHRGPQTVLAGRSQIALGFGMAQRIFVEVER